MAGTGKTWRLLHGSSVPMRQLSSAPLYKPEALASSWTERGLPVLPSVAVFALTYQISFPIVASLISASDVEITLLSCMASPPSLQHAYLLGLRHHFPRAG